MTASSLPAALRAGADGLHALEAATGLIIAHASWLAREDRARFIHVGTSIADPGTEMASIEWEAAIYALGAGELPSSAVLTELTAKTVIIRRTCGDGGGYGPCPWLNQETFPGISARLSRQAAPPCPAKEPT